MDLLLVRHAQAEDAVRDDASRALTPEGRARFAAGVRGLSRLGLELDLVLCSPLRRARETAELLATLASGNELRECAELAAPPGLALFDRIEGAFPALVGHEPWMGQLAAWLTCGTREHAGPFAFKKGGVAWLRGRPTPAGMHWVALLPPRALDALAGQ